MVYAIKTRVTIKVIKTSYLCCYRISDNGFAELSSLLLRDPSKSCLTQDEQNKIILFYLPRNSITKNNKESAWLYINKIFS